MKTHHHSYNEAGIVEVSDKRKSRYIFYAVFGIILLIGILHASSLIFINDDAFLSFRYAQNLVKGLGLVFNAGERVEGYTNFLWVIIIAAGMKLGIDPVKFSATLGIFFYTGTLLIFTYLSWRLRIQRSARFILIPLTALVLSVHRDFNAYATSGLETSMFTFFVSATFASLLLARSFRSFIGVGLLLLIVMLTRPDGAIFLAGSLIYLIIKRESKKNILGTLIPIILILTPYWLWRFNYYGYPFPNTYYAKSINLSYYSQGFEYALLYLKTYYGLVLIFVLGIAAVAQSKITPSQNTGEPLFRWFGKWDDMKRQPILLAGIFVVLYTIFVIRIGGDFMFARFFIPITPLAYFIIERLIQKTTKNYVAIATASILVVSTIFRNDLFTKELNVGYIVDEVRFYNTQQFLKNKSTGEGLRKYFAGVPVRVAFWGAQTQIVYYAEPQYAIEANTGLTDIELAHQPLHERGRPGHEKTASLAYLQKKRVNFFFGPLNAPSKENLPINAILFDSTAAQIVTYANNVMTTLSKFRDVQFVRIPEFLDSYITELYKYPMERIRNDLAFFKVFYFDINNDSLREKTILASLEKPQNP